MNKKTLETVDPKGRLDVLAFRILERAAKESCPQEWEMAKPIVEDVLTRLIGPKGKLLCR